MESSFPPPPARVVCPFVIAPPPARALPRARRVPERCLPRAFRKRPPLVPLMFAFGVFAAMMMVSVGHLAYGLLDDTDLPSLTTEQIRTQLMIETAVFEGLDTVIVLVGLLIAGWPRACAAAGNRWLTWLLSAPGFVFLLGVNLAYHLSLKWLVSQYVTEPVPQYIDIGLAQGWLAVLLICVQPAVIEELFFRYLLLGHLRSHVGMHGAVWISAIVFGMAHLGNIPGWPVLILLGAGLGYARVYSGSLLLPVLLHFLHNLAVLGIDYMLLQ